MGLFDRRRPRQEGPKPQPEQPPPVIVEAPLPEEPTFMRELEFKPPPYYSRLLEQVQQRLVEEKATLRIGEVEPARKAIEPIVEELLTQESILVSRRDKERLVYWLAADIVGYGPIQPLLDDPDITEVMVNGPEDVYVERAGKLHKVPVRFRDTAHVMRIIERIVAPIGRRVDDSWPMADARLPDGSRVNIIIPPLALNGPCITIRKFFRRRFTMEDLIRLGSVTREFAIFAEAIVKGRLNIIVSGGTGSGKTTLLNILSGYIPNDERIVTIEDAAELQLQQEHVVRLEARPPNIEGKGAVRIRDLVINALRMRPDRIVVGEVRGGEALDMLQAMNTGHDGSLTTLHANSPRDALARLETMVLMAGMDLPLRAIRQQIASAVDVIIHVSRLRDGSRKVVAVSEIVGMEGDTILMQDIFRFEIEGFENGRVIGQLRPTGIRPRLVERLADYDIHLPPEVFGLPVLGGR